MLLLATLVTLTVLATRTPAWYGQTRLTPQQQSRAAQDLEVKIAGLGNQLGSRLGSQIAERQSTPSAVSAASTAPVRAPPPDNRVTLILTEAELNAFYRKWMTYDSLDTRVEQFVKTPEIRLMKNQILMGGEVPAVGAIIWGSLDIVQHHAKPPTVSMGRVYAGRLPIPRAVWGNWSTPLLDQLSKSRHDWESKAQIWPANPEGVILASFSQLRRIHDGDSIEPVFLIRTSLGNRVLPVKVWRLDVRQGMMAAEVEVLEEPAAREWLQKQKQ